MASRFHTNDETIIVNNYETAVDVTKQKLYDGDCYTSTDSSINIAARTNIPARTIHRYQVFPSKDIGISMVMQYHPSIRIIARK
jgi:transglutaminase-like putative cysteine protease